MIALVLLLGSLVGMVVAVAVAVCGIVAVVRHGRRARAGLLRGGALLALGAAIGAYAWGAAQAGAAALEAEDGGTDSSPLRPCRGEADPATVARVVDYRVGLVPLRFECRLTGGGSYATSVVSGFVNPVAGLLGGAGTVGAVASAVVAERRPRRSEDRVGAELGPGS
ncbi:hypothetical protein [Actinomadura sp. 9N215]|uniref:hypothetical protein n=1 Tax=Actinomadura sp. 9N215 TaxID=3375150 RepID=UPI003796B957